MESRSRDLSMIKAFRLVCASIALVVSASGLHAQEPRSSKSATDRLRAGDVVKLWIWREEDLSGEFVVPETGLIVFPKIGSWQVTERGLSDLKSALITEYQKYLRNPSIEITFLRRVNVLGAVKEPGVYSLDETMTIANALALAGGALPGGKQNEVQLFRNGEKIVTQITQLTRIADLPLQSGDQLYVPERSWAARNSSLIAALLSGAVSVAVAIIVNK